ncbi:rCG63184 [Rattus norvegicus]|uniref:RCG63184 n=1 Tax=Rattus norvegicus TaxID=10116 RepID=A6JYN1_RAT|nr:rCG63184 [Rattus norvegicus]
MCLLGKRSTTELNPQPRIFFLKRHLFHMNILSLSSDTPEEGIRSHYRWL